MKLRHILLLTCCVVAFPVMAQKQLEILHTNDTHSCVMPLGSNLADTAFADRGGFLRRIAMLKEERRKNPSLLLFDSGDFCQGSAYFTLYKGDVEVNLMNMMHYDAVTIGNHEFDFGLDNMARLFRMANFPIVCSNYDFKGTVVEGLVKPWIIIHRNGVKIGVFGLSPALDGLVDIKNCPGVKFLDPVKTALDVATFLKRDKKCDLVICISHLGWKLDDYDDVRTIEGSRNIDLVLGGHSHTYFQKLEYCRNLDGKWVGVDQNGKHGIWIGRLLLNMKRK